MSPWQEDLAHPLAILSNVAPLQPVHIKAMR